MPQPSLPEPFFIDRIESPIGVMIAVHDPDGRMRALEFADHEPRMRELLRLHYGTEGQDFVLQNRRVPDAIRQALTQYFAGELEAIDRIPVVTSGTAFQDDVWVALRGIRVGTTLSYGALAQRVGRPKSVRAVGHANGANPISIVIPCHRVIGADGSLTGYGGGLDRKRWLLAHEGVAVG
jgi:methylated-DNA-[protein]-cysteine S-methyltransferase